MADVTQQQMFNPDPPDCARCDGTGTIVGLDRETGDSSEVVCPLCGGSGEQYDPRTAEWPPGF